MIDIIMRKANSSNLSDSKVLILDMKGVAFSSFFFFKSIFTFFLINCNNF